jgi:hypothetical protein
VPNYARIQDKMLKIVLMKGRPARRSKCLMAMQYIGVKNFFTMWGIWVSKEGDFKNINLTS